LHGRPSAKAHGGQAAWVEEKTKNESLTIAVIPTRFPKNARLIFEFTVALSNSGSAPKNDQAGVRVQ
jgi:hypothetical protein